MSPHHSVSSLEDFLQCVVLPDRVNLPIGFNVLYLKSRWSLIHFLVDLNRHRDYPKMRGKFKVNHLSLKCQGVIGFDFGGPRIQLFPSVFFKPLHWKRS